MQVFRSAGACRADAASAALGGRQCSQSCKSNSGVHAPAIGHDRLVCHCALIVLTTQWTNRFKWHGGSRCSTRRMQGCGGRVAHAHEFRLRPAAGYMGFLQAWNWVGVARKKHSGRAPASLAARSLGFAICHLPVQLGEMIRGAGACSRPRAMASSCGGAMGRPQW